jgi:hypothetical protein
MGMRAQIRAAQVRKIKQLNNQVNERATILFGRGNALKKSERNAYPHKGK